MKAPSVLLTVWRAGLRGLSHIRTQLPHLSPHQSAAAVKQLCRKFALRSDSQRLCQWINFLIMSLCNQIVCSSLSCDTENNPVPHPSTDPMCDFCFFPRPVLWMKMLSPPPVTSSLSSFSPQPKAKNLREGQMLKSIEVSCISSARLWNVVELQMFCVGDGFGDPRLLSDVLSVFLLVCALRTEINFCVDVIQVALCWSRLWRCLITAGCIVTRTNVFTSSYKVKRRQLTVKHWAVCRLKHLSRPEASALTLWALSRTFSKKTFSQQVTLMSHSQPAHSFHIIVLPFFFFFLPNVCFLPSTRSSSQPSLSITWTEESQCHPGSRRAQPCGHQRHLRQHGLLCPRPHRHPQETAEPHGGCTLWRSRYAVGTHVFVYCF